MYRNVTTFKLVDGTYVSQLCDHEFSLGLMLPVKKDGCWTEGEVVCIFPFYLDGRMDLINDQ